MAPDDIVRKLEGEPFRPLRIYLSDGGTVDLGENDRALVLRMEFIIGLDLDEGGIPRRSVYIDPRHVTRIERGEAAPASSDSGNGRS